MTRILLTGTATGDVWRYCLELAQGCGEAGVEPVLALLGPPPTAAQAAEASAIAGLRLIVTRLPAEGTLSDEDELRATGAALAGLASRLDVVSVHLHTPALAAEVAWSVPVVAVAHSDAGVRWATLRGGPMPPELAWRAAAVARGLAEADVAIAPTRSFARALLRLHRPGRRIEVVPHGVSPLPVPAAPRSPLVLSAGRLWDEGKNVALLDRAAAQLEAPILAAGPLRGPNGETASFAALHTPGPLEQPALAALLAQATVFASPSRAEAFGLPVLEAAQAGLALALADIPAFRELWDGVASFFHPDDAEACATVLARLLASPAGAGARAQERARRYAPEAMVRATLDLHRPLVSPRPD